MYKVLYLNLARNSLRYIIKTYNIKQLHIPYYLCNVIRQSIVREYCKPIFYHIDDNFLPDRDFNKDDFVLYPNYFGICGENVNLLSEKYKNLIVDNAHSFYSEPKGLACFNSARKFFNIYNGSVLWIKNKGININYKTEEFKSISDDENEKIKSEILFMKKEPAFVQSDFLSDKFKNTENMRIKTVRIFEKLHKKYKDINCLKINTKNIYSPFCYPLLCENKAIADKKADELINKGFKIYRYWNSMPETYNEYKFYRNLVPVPLT